MKTLIRATIMLRHIGAADDSYREALKAAEYGLRQLLRSGQIADRDVEKLDNLLAPEISHMSTETLATDVRDTLSCALVNLVSGSPVTYGLHYDILTKMPPEVSNEWIHDSLSPPNEHQIMELDPRHVEGGAQSDEEISAEKGSPGVSCGSQKWWQPLQQQEEPNLIDSKIAHRFFENEGSIDLSHATHITEEAAKIIIKYEWGLHLDGLTDLTVATATILSGIEGDWLSLNGLKMPSNEVIEALSRSEKGLYLDGMATLSLPAAKALSKLRGCLSLNGLPTIGIDILKLLVANQDELSLNGLNRLSEPMARVLSGLSGTIRLDGLPRISNKVAVLLARRKSHRYAILWLEGISTLTTGIAKSLSLHPGGLYLGGIEKITDRAATEISRHRGWMLDLGVKEISLRAAKALSGHEESLRLCCLAEISDAVAAALSEHKGLLYLRACPMGGSVAGPRRGEAKK